MSSVSAYRHTWRTLSRQSRNRLRTTTASRFYSVGRKCPSCSAPLPTALPTCPNCSHIEPLSTSMSHYDLFDLPTSPNPFKVDVRDLKRRFLQSQKVCHPDAWSGKGRREHDIAVAQSSRLNEAYKTLLSPVQRAQYILAQHGVETSESEKLDEPELIMEVLEAREELEDASSEEDVSNIRRRNRDKMQNAETRLETLIEEQKWDEARHVAVHLKYWQGIDEAAKEWRRT